MDEGVWRPDPLLVRDTYRRHLLQTVSVDDMLSHLIDHLEANGLFDDSLIVVTADHGANFSPGDMHRWLTETNVHDIMSVPLLIKYPHQQDGRRDERFTQSIDILPTVLDVVGLSAAEDLDGVSLLDSAAADRTDLDFLDQDRKQHRTFPNSRLLDRSKTIQWKQTDFADVGAVADIYAVGAPKGLLGLEVSEFQLAEATGLQVLIDHAERYMDIKLNARFVPGEITGKLLGHEKPGRADLAIAVAGRVVGFTRTYLPQENDAPREWSVVVPREAFREGRNTLDVFLVDQEGGSTALRRLTSPSVSFLGAVLGGRAVAGVDESGFHQPSRWEGTPYRWTNGHATLHIPLLDDDEPAEVGIELVSTGSGRREVSIRANGEELFAAQLHAGPWIGTLPLSEIDVRATLTLEIVSSTFVAESNSRTLGVGVSKVILR